MQIRNIVVPTDFSAASDAAMRYATSVARDTGAVLSIVHCEDPENTDAVAFTGFGPVVVTSDPSGSDADSKLRTVTPGAADVAYTQHLLHGNPAESISNFAEETGADLIVMGTHGRKGVSRLLMGSVAESVVRHSTCPVVSIKQPNAAQR